jgi:cyclic pyranopterin phosphate synthase
MQTPIYDSHKRVHRYLRMAVTDRCNLRCAYCKPAEGFKEIEKPQLLRFDETMRIARVFAEMGVTKIRLTGGEPLMRQDIVELVTRLRTLEGVRIVAITSNGLLLSPRLRALMEAGLGGLNISLDTLQPERFTAITGLDDFARVWKGLQAALDAGFRPLKLNVVVMKGVNDDELLDFVELTRSNLLAVRFIEYMPFKSNAWDENGLVPYADMLASIGDRYELLPMPARDAGAVAKEFCIPGHKGSVAFITSMSEHFCDSCERVRITADGSIKNCLFSPAESNLRDILRGGGGDRELRDAIRGTVATKWAGHPPAAELKALATRSMIQIGG